MKPVPALLVLLLPLAACDSGGARSGAGFAVDTLANGAVSVSNPATGTWMPGQEWRLRSDLILGASEGSGPDVFGQIVAIEVDQEGNLYVVDGGANEIRVFGPTGEFLHKFGRAGAGPGEFRQPVAAGFGPDGNLWVLDFGNRRWSILDTSGEYVRQVSRPVNHFSQPWPGGFDSSGNILDAVGRGTLGVMDTVSASVDSFEIATEAPEVFEIRTENMTTSFTVPFSPHMVWKADREGNVWSGDGSTYQLLRRTPSGDTLTILRREHTPRPVSAAERELAVQQVQAWASPYGAEPDVSRIPASRPAYSDFYIAEDGHIWVVTEPELGEFMITYSRFDVFDPEGRFLGTAVSDTPILPYVVPIFRGDQIVAVTVDDMHVMYVVRLQVEK